MAYAPDLRPDHIAHTDLATVRIRSPLGPMLLGASDEGLVLASFVPESPEAEASRPSRPHPVLEQATRELDAYLAGALTMFTVPLAPRGTPFQLAVWRALVLIPCGERVAYRDIARAIGRVGADRAVGAANGQNRIAIIIPCHRVIGADGTLTGYAGGLDKKRWLLEHEARGASAYQADLFPR